MGNITASLYDKNVTFPLIDSIGIIATWWRMPLMIPLIYMNTYLKFKMFSRYWHQ